MVLNKQQPIAFIFGNGNVSYLNSKGKPDKSIEKQGIEGLKIFIVHYPDCTIKASRLYCKKLFYILGKKYERIEWL